MTGTPFLLANVLAECHAQGIRLSLDHNGGLTIDAPRNALTPDLLDRLKVHKADLVDSVEGFEERAGIMEFDASLPRREAEQLAWNDCFTQRTATNRI